MVGEMGGFCYTEISWDYLLVFGVNLEMYPFLLVLFESNGGHGGFPLTRKVVALKVLVFLLVCVWWRNGEVFCYTEIFGDC